MKFKFITVDSLPEVVNKSTNIKKFVSYWKIIRNLNTDKITFEKLSKDEYDRFFKETVPSKEMETV